MGSFVVAVSSTGSAMWLAPLTITTSCLLDMKYFPWDYQHCFFEYGSWTFDMGSIDVLPRKENIDYSYHIKNGEWDIIASPVSIILNI